MDMSKVQFNTSSENGHVVLCGASSYEQKYYFNRTFQALPESIQKDLHIICVLFTEEIGGEFLIEFNEEGSLEFRTQASASDYNYDEIGGALMIKQIRADRRELLESLELFYKVVILGTPLEEA